MANLERHQYYSPYHYCASCGKRRPLAEMGWQLGSLVCNDTNTCKDLEQIGQRELEINRFLMNNPEEMMPDKKLTQPDTTGIIEDIIL